MCTHCLKKSLSRKYSLHNQLLLSLLFIVLKLCKNKNILYYCNKISNSQYICIMKPDQ